MNTRGTPVDTKLSFRPAILLMSALFFLAATPFEVAQSGFGYLIKALAVGAMVAYAVIVQGARTGPVSLLPLLIILSFLLANLLHSSERAIIALLCMGTGLLLGQTRGGRWDQDFRSIVTMFLALHVAALLVVTLTFFATGNVLDLHGIVFPHASRTEAHAAFVRLAGLYNEPGTYSQWTLMALYLLALARGQLISLWHFLITISVLFTFSLWGVVAVGIFFFAFLVAAIMTQGIGTKFKHLLGVLALSLLVGAGAMLVSPDMRDAVVEFLIQKASLTTESGNDKVASAEFFAENFSSVILLGQPLDPGFCPQCISPQDAGLGLTATYYVGFASFAALILAFLVRTMRLWNLSFVVPVLLVLFWKAHVYEPLLWIIFGFVFRGPAWSAASGTPRKTHGV